MLKQKEIFLPTISSSSLAASSSQIPTRRTDSKTDTDSSSSLPPGTWLNLISEAGLDLDDSSFSTSISQIISLSRALTLPSIFADSNWQTDSESIDALSGWTNNEAPRLLTLLSQALHSLSFGLSQASKPSQSSRPSSSSEAVKIALLAAVVAASRFLPPLEISTLHEVSTNQDEATGSGSRSDLMEVEQRKDGLDPWMTKRNRNAAKGVLSHPALTTKPLDPDFSITTPSPLDLAKDLLSNHIKPLFLSHLSNSSKLNSTTSRPIHRDPNLVKSVGGGHAPSAEDVVWKGGALDGEGRRFLVSNVEDDPSQVNANSRVGERNQVLGSWNVLAWCIDTISKAQLFDKSTSLEENPWDTSVSLVLPPLLALLDDPTPHFRFIGATILGRCALRSFEEKSNDTPLEELGSIPPTLLIRLGVAPLLLDSLESSLTYTNDERDGSGPRLLDASLRASRALILLTTFNSNSAIISPSTFLEDDAGSARSLKLHSLVVEGILKVWSYLPSIPSSFTTSERQQAHHSTLQITFYWLQILCKDLGAFSARFSGLVIEFLSSKLDLGFDQLEDELPKRQKEMELFWKNLEGKVLTCLAASAALKQLLNSLLSVSQSQSIPSSTSKEVPEVSIPPSFELWGEGMVAACARCWVQLNDLDAFESTKFDLLQQKIELRNGLKEILKVSGESNSVGVKGSLDRVRLLDPVVFGPLLPPLRTSM